MKLTAIALAIFWNSVSCLGEMSPRREILIGANRIEVFWNVPSSNSWPSMVWVYRIVPQNFSSAVVSNLMALGPFTMADLTNIEGRPPFKDKQMMYFRDKTGRKELGIFPPIGWIYYNNRDAEPKKKESSTVPDDQKTLELGLEHIKKFGIDRSQLATKADCTQLKIVRDVGTRGRVTSKAKNEADEVINRGVFFIRRIDGIDFDGIGTRGGVYLNFGNDHKIARLEIVWKAPTNNLPKSYEVFIRAPRIFSAEVISNAIVLASFPLPRTIVASKNNFRLQDGEEDRWSRALNVLPESGQIDYQMRFDPVNSKGVPTTDEVSKRAWESVARFGINPSELFEKPERREMQNCGHKNEICSRRTFLTRKVEEIEMRDFGFGITFGGGGEIRRFELLWPDLTPHGTQAAASLEEITLLLRANKAAVLPNEDEPDYFARIKTLAKTQKLTIIKITPFYAEGQYGEPPEKQQSSNLISPVVELDGFAELNNTTVNVRLLSPILTTNLARLLKPGKN